MAADPAQLALGTRVVVRYLIEDGERATDALGVLTHRSAEVLTVATRTGPVGIPRRDVGAAKPVPPPPPRRRRSREDE